MQNMEFTDRLAIRELIEDWAVWRDSGQWERLATTFHDDGWMVTTWRTAPFAAFIEGSRAAWNEGVKVFHTLAGTSIDIRGPQAIAQTKMSIVQRAKVHDVWCDVTCRGRFYDFLERRNGRWAILARQPIYEYVRLDPIDPGISIPIDRARLEHFPEGYRHLAYLQSANGFEVRTNLPGLNGAEVETVYELGRLWLEEGTSPLPAIKRAAA